ncbi:MAG TPA: hypothetical protein VF809_01500 [Candidatus Saccharimonadales bacterium]
MATIKTVTNEDLLDIMQDLMQITSNGFDRLDQRMDRMESRMDSLESRICSIEQRLSAIEATLREHGLRIAKLEEIVSRLEEKHTAYISDISEILDRIVVLESRRPDITKAEFQELREQIQALSGWAVKAGEAVNIPFAY